MDEMIFDDEGPIDIATLLNPVDYNSIEVEITGRNETAKTEFKKVPPVTVTEVTERGMMIEVPRASCHDGHHLVLTIRAVPANRADKPMEFELTAFVTKFENVSDTNDRVTLDLAQYEEKDWKAFLTLFSSRQEDINSFLQAAKGY